MSTFETASPSKLAPSLVALAAVAGLTACGGADAKKEGAASAAAPGGSAEALAAGTADPHQEGAKKDCCTGKNECKGKGGCKTASNECAGKNECKGKGGCSMRDCN